MTTVHEASIFAAKCTKATATHHSAAQAAVAAGDADKLVAIATDVRDLPLRVVVDHVVSLREQLAEVCKEADDLRKEIRPHAEVIATIAAKLEDARKRRLAASVSQSDWNTVLVPLDKEIGELQQQLAGARKERSYRDAVNALSPLDQYADDIRRAVEEAEQRAFTLAVGRR